jgi:hypothetical protein
MAGKQTFCTYKRKEERSGRDGGLGDTSWVGETKTMGTKIKRGGKIKTDFTQVMCQLHLLNCQVVSIATFETLSIYYRQILSSPLFNKLKPC